MLYLMKVEPRQRGVSLLSDQHQHVLENGGVRESIVRIELLTFFQANPHTRDTAAGLARRLHRPLEDVAAAAAALARIGILDQNGSGPYVVYRLRHGELIRAYFEN